MVPWGLQGFTGGRALGHPEHGHGCCADSQQLLGDTSHPPGQPPPPKEPEETPAPGGQNGAGRRGRRGGLRGDAVCSSGVIAGAHGTRQARAPSLAHSCLVLRSTFF